MSKVKYVAIDTARVAHEMTAFGLEKLKETHTKFAIKGWIYGEYETQDELDALIEKVETHAALKKSADHLKVKNEELSGQLDETAAKLEDTNAKLEEALKKLADLQKAAAEAAKEEKKAAAEAAKEEKKAAAEAAKK
jgi:uncharacterized coiled-coil protein SlyX